MTTPAITFQLDSVPPSFGNRWAKHWAVQARERKGWKERTYFAAHDARVRARRALPTNQRVAVEIELHRARLLDHDNAYSSVKPILDALCGVLIVDDAPKWCDLVVRQIKVDHRAQQHVVVTIS